MYPRNLDSTMCGYCTERIDIFTLWQHGRFAPPAEAEPSSVYSISLECPGFNQLLAMQQNHQPLAADIVLIRLACYALTQPLDSAAQQLCQAMRNQLTAEHIYPATTEDDTDNDAAWDEAPASADAYRKPYSGQNAI